MAADPDSSKLDIAARAAWLYFIAGNTQEEIALKLRVSRPTAQRLVSLALDRRLVTFRFEHKISSTMELSEKLSKRLGLQHCEVVPTDPSAPESIAGIAACAAAFMEQTLSSSTPVVMAIGTGRTLRAAVEQIQPLNCPQHTLVGLVGNVATDGAASFFDVLSRLADLTKAQHFPIPLPVLADTEEQRDSLAAMRIIQRTVSLAHSAQVTLVGVGQMDLDAQQHIDGFISREELLNQIRLGAVGEITGWSFTADGKVMDGGVNGRVTSVPLCSPEGRLVIGVACGQRKVPAIISAIRGNILNGLITDELTAQSLLDEVSN